MVLNVLRISSSNVFKMSLNVIVSILYTFVNFYLHKPTGGTNARYQLPAHPGQRQESNAVIKKHSKTKLYMHKTVGDVAQIISITLCSIQSESSSLFLSLVYVLSTF